MSDRLKISEKRLKPSDKKKKKALIIEEFENDKLM